LKLGLFSFCEILLPTVRKPDVKRGKRALGIRRQFGLHGEGGEGGGIVWAIRG